MGYPPKGKHQAPIKRHVTAFSGLDVSAFGFWGSPVLTAADGTYFCPGFQGNTYATNPWDFCIIGNHVTPGICEVSIDKERVIDTKKPAGADGERLTASGMKSAHIQIAITIWTPEQLRVLKSMWLHLFPPAGKATGVGTAIATGASTLVQGIAPFDVSHPNFDQHSIRAILINGAHGLSPGSFPRSRVFTINAIEFLLPKTQNVTISPGAAEPLGSVLDPGVLNYPTPGSDPKNTGPS